MVPIYGYSLGIAAQSTTVAVRAKLKGRMLYGALRVTDTTPASTGLTARRDDGSCPAAVAAAEEAMHTGLSAGLFWAQSTMRPSSCTSSCKWHGVDSVGRRRSGASDDASTGSMGRRSGTTWGKA